MSVLRNLSIGAAVCGALLASPAWAEKVGGQRFRSAVPVAADASILIDNPIGPVIVVGTDKLELRWEVVKNVRAIDDKAFHEGLSLTRLHFEGHEKSRVLRTLVPYPLRNGRWESVVSYRVEIPRSASLTIVNVSSALIRVVEMDGAVVVKNVNARIELDRVSGPLQVESVNGAIYARFPTGPRANCLLSSVNGRIEVSVARDAPFTWIAQTIRGGIHSSVPLQGFFRRHQGSRVYQAMNRKDGPTIETVAMMGEVFLLAEGTEVAAARPISQAEEPSPQRRASLDQPQPLRPEMRNVYQQVAANLLQAPTARSFAEQRMRVAGDFLVDASIGSIFAAEVDGDARLTTRAGEIVVGRLSGGGELRSLGGSLHLGDVAGPLNAQTSVGDIQVRAARQGGRVITEAGNINVEFSGGPITLRSGGGDVSVRQAAAAVDAQTRSGDVVIGIARGHDSIPIAATTDDGNLILNISSRFAADVDAVLTIVATSSNVVFSDIPGLTIVREPMGDRVRIRASGKLNGGGPKVTLRASGGNIQILSGPMARNVTGFPR